MGKGKRKGKRNNSLKAIKEKSFSPGLLLKIVQSVTMILSVFAITVVATASFYRTDSKKVTLLLLFFKDSASISGGFDKFG